MFLLNGARSTAYMPIRINVVYSRSHMELPSGVLYIDDTDQFLNENVRSGLSIFDIRDGRPSPAWRACHLL